MICSVIRMRVLNGCLLGIAAATLCVIACGLGTMGTGGLTPDEGPEASADAGIAAPTPEAAPGCAPVVTFTDGLTTIDTTRWLVIKDGSNGDHPKAVTGGESPLDGGVVSLVTPGVNNSRGGLWLAMPLPTRAFDVTLSTMIVCKPGCADGFAVAWVDTTDKSVLDKASSGRTFGIPPGVDGGAMSLDLYKNTESSDPPVPYLGLLGVEGTKSAGNYAWNAAVTPPTPALINALHTIALRMRGGTLTVSVDGTAQTSGAVPSGFSGFFGITAATGGAAATFLVRDVSASFYDCDP